MAAAEKLQKAKMSLLLSHPFYSALLFQVECIEDNSCETCTINGKTIRYNGKFVEELSNDKLVGVLAHEILHLANCHHTRRGTRDKSTWNRATDYAINGLLLNDKFELPVDRLYEPIYDGKSAEEIYSMIKGDSDSEPGEKEDPGGCGAVDDPPVKDEEELLGLELDIQQAVLQALMIAQAQNKCPEYIKRLVEETLRPKVNWKEALAQYLSELSKNDFSWIKPNTRYLHTGLYLPALHNEEPGAVILIIDTSGSISDKMVSQFAAEVQEILSVFKISLTIIYVDEEVRSVQSIAFDDPIELEPLGGQGTSFIPGFVYIQENDLQPRAVVYLTDGCCSSFPDCPDYPVIWAKYGYYHFTPPFGYVIEVK